MVQGNAILVVDLGNSSTKATVMFGKNKDGLYKERTFELSNSFSPIEAEYDVPEEYTTSTSTIFAVEGMEQGRLYCNGEVQEKEFNYTGITPTALEKKYESEVTDLTINLTFIHAYKALMSIANVSRVEDLDVTWSVIALLPPGDLNQGKVALENKFRNVSYVKGIFPVMVTDIKIKDVLVLPEGFCAYAAIVYKRGAKKRKGYSFLKEQKVLVLDIGAGTTDCMIIEDNKVISASRYTITQGGNNVKQQVIKICSEKGLHLTEESFAKGVIRGKVYDGAKPIDIVPAINRAKSLVAASILKQFQGYLEGSNINLRDVGYVLVCGGGSIQPTENKAIKPLSTQIIEKVKRISPETLLVDLPTEQGSIEAEDGSLEQGEVELNARYLNLIGASILAEIRHK